jgi:hypothetical protein
MEKRASNYTLMKFIYNFNLKGADHLEDVVDENILLRQRNAACIDLVNSEYSSLGGPCGYGNVVADFLIS